MFMNLSFLLKFLLILFNKPAYNEIPFKDINNYFFVLIY